VKRRIVRNQRQALVRWRVGLTSYRPSDPFWAEVHSIVSTQREKDSWELAEDVEAAVLGKSHYTTTAAASAGSMQNTSLKPLVVPVARKEAPKPAVASRIVTSGIGDRQNAGGDGTSGSVKNSKRKLKRKIAILAPPRPSEALAYAFDYNPPTSGDDDDEENTLAPPSRRRVPRPETWSATNHYTHTHTNHYTHTLNNI
jgi:hypothetical protein